ncbi:MAG: hypothetical protein WCD66_12495 [Rhodanobacteraceae bacterium]
MQRRKFLTVIAAAAGGMLTLAGASTARAARALTGTGAPHGFAAGEQFTTAGNAPAGLTLIADVPLSRYQSDRQRLLRFRADADLHAGIHELCDSAGNTRQLFLEPAHDGSREWVAVVNTATA